MSTELPETPHSEQFIDDDGVLYDEEVTPEYGVLGLTLRELLIVGVWIVSFVVSFLPVAGNASLWTIGVDWVLPIALPTVAVFLIVLRRFSPDGIRRVGSLGIDQFASVAFTVSAFIWFGIVWRAIAVQIEDGIWVLSWHSVVLLITALALVALTVFAPIIPRLKEDFQGRLVTLAHRNANPVRPVIARPRPEAAPVLDTAPETADTADAQPEADAAPDVLPAAAPAPATVAPVPAELAPAPYNVPLDVELSGNQATDEVARLDLAEQVPLAAHASGGGTGTISAIDDQEYVPTYSRRSRNAEIVSDTASIESLLQTAARFETGEVTDTGEIADAARSAAAAETAAIDAGPATEAIDVTAQPFWILAPTEREVHDVQGDPVFTIGPDAWALVIEDRGGAYLIRHDDGRIGFLHEISDVKKG